jgi:hypothetical protein
MKTSDLFYMLIVFTLVGTGFTLLIGYINGHSDGYTPISSDFENKQLNNSIAIPGLDTTINQMGNSIQKVQKSSNPLTIILSLALALFETAWAIILTIIQFVIGLPKWFGNLLGISQLPSVVTIWIGGIIGLLIITFIVFEILSVIFNKDL